MQAKYRPVHLSSSASRDRSTNVYKYLIYLGSLCFQVPCAVCCPAVRPSQTNSTISVCCLAVRPSQTNFTNAPYAAQPFVPARPILLCCHTPLLLHKLRISFTATPINQTTLQWLLVLALPHMLRNQPSQQLPLKQLSCKSPESSSRYKFTH